MIESIVPNGVAAAELLADPPDLQPHPMEAALISKAVEKRRREFITARHCARLAMGKLGVEPAPVLRGEAGSPVWPKGVVGSLTHCDGYRAAVVAYGLQVRSVGIDAEPHGPLPDGVLDAVSLPAERDVLSQRSDDGIHWDRLLFSAKESTYKAWFPLTGRWLGFEDAHITFDRAVTSADSPPSGTFQSTILISGETTAGPPLRSMNGRWTVDGGLVLTAVTID